MKRNKQSLPYPLLYQIVLLATLLLAAGLRFTKLDAQSFWNDEGNTARLVERSIHLILSGAAGDVHPPGYYLILRGWRDLTGETEFALRSFSALCGVITVALTTSVAQEFIKGWDPKLRVLALPALWFITLHPLSVYYSQEARMYAQLGMVAAGLLWAAVKFHKVFIRSSTLISHHHRVSTFSLLACMVALGLYTHYAFVFALFSLSCAFGLYWLIHNYRNWRMLLTWLGAFAAGGLLFVPWAPVALRASGWRPPDLGTANAVQSLARTLVIGVTLPDNEAGYILPLLAVLGLLILYKLPRASFASWAALSMAYLPPLMIAVLGLYRPAYLKFLIISISPLAACLSASISGWFTGSQNRYWLVVLLFCTLIVFTPAQIKALHHLYHDPSYARDDYRGIVNYIMREAQTEDAVLLNAPNQWEVFTYYYRGDLPIYTTPYRPTAQDAVSWVEDIVEMHPQLFMLYWGDTEADPDRFIEVELAQQAFKANERWISSVRLVRYGTASVPLFSRQVNDITLGSTIQLTGYSMPEASLNPGEILPLTLIWSACTPLSERYKVFIHLVNDASHLVAQTDAEPVGGFHLTNQWAVGEEVRDNYGVLLPEDVEPGQYRILVGMYDFSGTRLIVGQDGNVVGDSLHLDSITVQSPQ